MQYGYNSTFRFADRTDFDHVHFNIPNKYCKKVIGYEP